MEIGPIPGIRALPSVEPKGNGIDLTAVFAIKDSPRTGDETYNGKAKQSAGGQDDEETDLLDETADPEPSSKPSTNGPGNQISFFA
jgi:hypothetical protein